ncbi:MAG: hypothetical protein AAB969_02725 [Patescibacteria group bacterium]
MLISLFLALFIFIAIVSGLPSALLVFGGIIVVIGVVLLAMYLIVD